MPVVAGYDPRPSNNLRVEVAFATQPDDPSPAWVDLTSRLDLAAGVSITRGRSDEFSQVQPSTCSLTLDNSDGALTAGNSGSSFYPNVKPSRKIRVSYRNPSIPGNLFSNPSFETDTSGWVGYGSGAVAQSTAVGAVDGSQAALVTYSTSLSGVRSDVSGLVIGRTYTVSFGVWNPTGNPSVAVTVQGVGTSTRSSVNGAWQRLSYTFVATLNTHRFQFGCIGTGGTNQFYMDAPQLDEGSAAATFTASPPPIAYRFTGYVEEWPVEWPNGGAYAQATITAVDRLARIGAKRTMRSLIEEAILYLDPAAYWPLGEPEGATLAGDYSGAPGVHSLAVTQTGIGGSLDFGTATGPPTDALPAPTFTPASSTQGKYLSGSMAFTGGLSSVTLRGNFLTSVVGQAVIARIVDPYGCSLTLQVSTAGKLQATLLSGFSGTIFSLASSASVTDGATHDAVVTLSRAGATITVVLYLDGTSVASTTYTASFIYGFTHITVGGRSGGDLFTGTIAHVAAYNVAITAAQVAEINTSTTTGFAGESSDARIARYAKWAGIPTAEQVLDSGSSQSIAFTDTTGQSIAQAMQDVASTENGILFMDGAGNLTFHARARSYDNAPAVASVDAHLLGANSRFNLSTQGMVNDVSAQRPDGPVVRAFDQSSIDEYGVSAQSLTALVTSDTEVADAVNWRVYTNSTPLVRIPQAELDAYTDSTGYQAQIRALELGDRLTVTGLPATAPASSVDLIVEGYSEAISLVGWTVTANTSNYSDVRSLVLDDASYGLLDGDNRLIY